MKEFICFIMLSISLNLFSQSIERQVIGSIGGTVSNTNANMSFTVGEMATVSLINDGVIFNQGFHQGVFSDIIDIIPLDIALYPNPTKGVFYIKGLLEKAFVNIYDISGRKVVENRFVTLDEVIDISTLSKGVYLVQIKVKNRFAIIKLILE